VAAIAQHLVSDLARQRAIDQDSADRYLTADCGSALVE